MSADKTQYFKGVFKNLDKGKIYSTTVASTIDSEFGVRLDLTNINYPTDTEIRPCNIALLPLISY